MKSSYKKIFIIVGIVVVIAMFAILLMTYVFRIDTPAVTSVRRALHLPAIMVDGHWISLAEIEDNTSSIKQFYENQDFSTMGIRIDFNTDDGQKRLEMQERKMINKLVEDVAIEAIADEWNITISDESVQTAMNRPMEEVGSKEDVSERLEKLYGWSLDDFGKKVVYLQLLREKVTAKFEQDNIVTEDMSEKINKAKKELDDGRTFGDVAKKYSEGSSAEDGGIMGWFEYSQLQDSVGEKVFNMEKGEYSDVIETPLGVHIVIVNEKEDQDGKQFVHISQIIVKKQIFVDYLNDKMKNMKVDVFLPEYKWDAENALVVFSDDAMVKFEESVYQNAQNTTNELLNN